MYAEGRNPDSDLMFFELAPSAGECLLANRWVGPGLTVEGN